MECVPLTEAERVLSFVKNAGELAGLNEDCGVRSSEAARGGAAAAGRVAEFRNSGKSLKSGCGVCRGSADGEGHDCCCEAVVGGGWLFTGGSERRVA